MGDLAFCRRAPLAPARFRGIAECLGVDYERLYGDDISAESPKFVSPDDEEVSNTAGLERYTELAADRLRDGLADVG